MGPLALTLEYGVGTVRYGTLIVLPKVTDLWNWNWRRSRLDAFKLKVVLIGYVDNIGVLGMEKSRLHTNRARYRIK